MSKIIDFITAKSTKELKLREIGNINITVYLDEESNYPIYYMSPNRKELTPIVDLLDNTLTYNVFELTEDLIVKKL